MTVISPECAVGKCTNCWGDAWDEFRDEPTDCEHPCHPAYAPQDPEPDEPAARALGKRTAAGTLALAMCLTGGALAFASAAGGGHP